jgi:hypothetical protein
MRTIRVPVTAVRKEAAAQLVAALKVCIREYRQAALDCPLAAGVVALHHRRSSRTPGRARRLEDTIRGFVLRNASRVDAVYLHAAAACCRAGGPSNCPLRSSRRDPPVESRD